MKVVVGGWKGKSSEFLDRSFDELLETFGLGSGDFLGAEVFLERPLDVVHIRAIRDGMLGSHCFLIVHPPEKYQGGAEALVVEFHCKMFAFERAVVFLTLMGYNPIIIEVKSSGRSRLEK